MVNNYDWTENLSTIDFLRDIGKHFPVNRMLARDVVRSRLEAGISYTEFSYVLLQSMDFLNLFRDHGVTLQFGGSDQWGNITGGVELIRRADGGTAHAFATPLVTKADGTKYGKTEGGALWLDPEMMSPYAFYQFWLNVEDEKLGELLRIFTFLSREEIEALEARHAEKPFLREASARSPSTSRRSCTAPRRPSGSRPPRRRCSAAATSPAWARRRWRPRSRGRHRRVDGPSGLGDRGPAGRQPGWPEQGRGSPDHQRGRRLPEQRAGHRPRAAAGEAT